MQAFPFLECLPGPSATYKVGAGPPSPAPGPCLWLPGLMPHAAASHLESLPVVHKRPRCFTFWPRLMPPSLPSGSFSLFGLAQSPSPKAQPCCLSFVWRAVPLRPSRLWLPRPSPSAARPLSPGLGLRLPRASSPPHPGVCLLKAGTLSHLVVVPDGCLQTVGTQHVAQVRLG